MKDNTDLSSIVPMRQPLAPVSLVVWLMIGLACMVIDPMIQPFLTHCGQVTAIRYVAESWQELDATTGVVLVLSAGVLLAWRDKGHTLIRFAPGLIGASLAVQTLKHLVGRVRPNDVGDVSVFVGPNNPFAHHAMQLDSMPSGHTTAAFAMAAMLAWRWLRFRWGWFVLAAGVGCARTLVDRHFVSDVIVGAWLGVVVAITVFKLCATRFTPAHNA